MDVRRKMVLIVIVSILLTAVPGAALIYSFSKKNTLELASATLEKTTAIFTTSAMQRFNQSEPKLTSLARLLEQELGKPVRPDELAAFHRVLQHDSDGVWRNRRDVYDGVYEAGIFLPPNDQENDLQKVRHLRIKTVLDTFGAAANKPLENIWYLSPHRSEIIFDRAYPEFVFEQKADNDYTKTPWVTYTSPELNPKKEFRFTPPLYDPVPKVWMVSALYPLYVDGRWIGSVGEDMQLSSVLETMFVKSQIYHGVQHFLLDGQGNFILAGAWQKQLESTPDTFRPDLSHEPQMQDLLKLVLTGTPRTLNKELLLQGRRYVVTGIRLEPLGWRYYRLTPVDEIMAHTRQLILTVVGMLLLVAVLTGGVIGTAMGRSITRRIKDLSNAMHNYATDHRSRFSAHDGGNDEISEAAQVFNSLADKLDKSDSERLLAEAAHRANEERLKFAFEGSGDGMWDWTIPTGAVFFSKRWKEMLGFSDDEISSNLDEWERRIHPDDKSQVMADIQAYFDGVTTSYRNEHRVLCKDGSYKWVLDRGIAIERDSIGKPIRMIGTHTDITDNRNHQLALQHMLETSPIAVRIAASGGRKVLFANQRYAELINCDPDKMLGVDPFYYYANKQDYEEILRQLSLGESVLDHMVQLTVPEKGVRWTLASYLPINYQDEHAVLGWFYDITDLRDAKERSEALARSKSEFLANMSHEIRTPMNGIIGLTELAMNQPTSPEIRDYLNKISSSSQSLLGILNDILDLSKLEAGRMEIESVPFDLDRVTDNLRNLFEERAHTKHLGFIIEVAAHTPRDLIGDALRIQQILSNLMGNALKFTEQGQVSLKIAPKEITETQAQITFTVEDTGIGIAEEDIARVFQPFSQLDASTSRKFGGTGLGLSISQRLLSLMGSEFTVTSQFGKGTAISFNLPLALATAIPRAIRQRVTHQAGDLTHKLGNAAKSLKGARILVAEDNTINQMVVKEYLKLSGIDAVIANDGHEALDALTQHDFDAVLMDVHMPVMDGIEATIRIREQEKFKELPVIALTADVVQEERERCISAGMNDFIAKPINPEALIAALTRWVKRA